MRRRGFTIAELIVSGFILGLLMTLAFSLYRTGAGAWKKGEAQTDLFRDLRTLTSRVAREVERSVYASASVDAEGFSCLSAMNDQGVFAYDALNDRPLWQKYLVFYRDAASGDVFLREVPLAPGSPEIYTPEPIELYDAGGGAALSSYFSDGRRLAGAVTSCRFILSQDALRLVVDAERKRYGSQVPERMHMDSLTGFRN